jgi:hypothetical protein
VTDGELRRLSFQSQTPITCAILGSSGHGQGLRGQSHAAQLLRSHVRSNDTSAPMTLVL